MKTKLPILKIDPDFQGLIPPLKHKEYEQLEKSIIQEGCRDSISVWRGYIIDGHNRYKICHKYNIDFTITVIELKSKEDAISWICADLLKNRDIHENLRRYLIGKKYYVEKTVGIMNITGTNQYTFMERKPHSGKTSAKVGAEYHVSHSTVNKYLQYAKAIDRLKIEFSDFALKILYGEIKISHDNLIELAQRPKSEVVRIINSTANSKKILASDFTLSEKHINTIPLPRISKSSVKDMPVFDPDAYVASLTLTIPSWISNIKRTAANSNVDMISTKAKYDLVETLNNLISISTIIKKILEEN